MAATFLLRRREGGPPLTEEEIRRSVRGNICRCTGYVNILRSIEAAAQAAGIGVEEAA
jgi:aerobic-type carbon monoxide dehydrogenase small subunit (CoxS/CutS family)